MQIILSALERFYHCVFKTKYYNQCDQFIFLFILNAILIPPAMADALAGRQDLIINQAFEIVLPEHAASVLLGNTDIADIISQTGDAVIVSGKRIGQTNLMVRDRTQKLIGNIMLIVKAPDTGNITVYRGAARAEYSCNNHCTILSMTGEAASANSSKAPNEEAQTTIK